MNSVQRLRQPQFTSFDNETLTLSLVFFLLSEPGNLYVIKLSLTNFICNLITEASNQLKHIFTLHFRFKISFSFELVGFQNCRIPNTNCKRERYFICHNKS